MKNLLATLTEYKALKARMEAMEAQLKEKRAEIMAEADAAAERAAELARDIAVAESEIKTAYEEITKSSEEIESKRGEIDGAKRLNEELAAGIEQKQKVLHFLDPNIIFNEFEEQKEIVFDYPNYGKVNLKFIYSVIR